MFFYVPTTGGTPMVAVGDEAWACHMASKLWPHHIVFEADLVPPQEESTSDYVRLGVDVPLPRHLDLEAGPVSVCTGCGRSTWAEEEIGKTCGMPLPSGINCVGTFPKMEN